MHAPLRGAIPVLLAGLCGWGTGRVLRHAEGEALKRSPSSTLSAEAAQITTRQETVAVRPAGGRVEEQTEDDELWNRGRQALPAERDPLAALSKAGDGTEAGPEVRVKIIQALARENVEAAWRALEQFGPSISGGSKEEKAGIAAALTAAAIESWPDEPAAFLEKLKTLPPWPGADGEKGTTPVSAREILKQKAAHWSTEEVATAAAELVKQDGGILTEQRRKEISEWFAGDLFSGGRDAFALARMLPEEARGLAWESVPLVEGLPRPDTEQIRALAETVPPEQWPPQAGAVLGFMGTEGEAILRNLPEVPASREIHEAFAAMRANDDPESAGAWVRSLPEGEAAKAAAGALVRVWSRFDEMSASVWIATLPPGAARDGAASALVNVIAATDPQAAQIWAESITDQDLREAALRTAVEKTAGAVSAH